VSGEADTTIGLASFNPRYFVLVSTFIVVIPEGDAWFVRQKRMKVA
jgi:hypothetical protein